MHLRSSALSARLICVVSFANYQPGDDKMENLINDILDCFALLLEKDGNLFECPLEINAPYDERKLHEVCINHRLAVHFENLICPKIEGERFYVDIEFNREGINFKELDYKGQEDRVRPDIIIHNRRSGDNKNNFLVVECKKEDAPDQKKNDDLRKLEAFIRDKKYKYKFGLQVIYGNHEIKSTLLFEDNGTIIKQELKRS